MIILLNNIQKNFLKVLGFAPKLADRDAASHFIYALTEGAIYFLDVDPFKDASSSYRLSISYVSDTVNGTDIGDAPEYAPDPIPQISGNTLITGSVGSGTDTLDSSTFRASSSAVASFALTQLNDDLDLYLYDGNGTRVASSEGSGSADEGFSSALTQNAIYFLDVEPYEGASSSYRLNISYPAQTDIINGTVIATGARFSYTQDQFDAICGDLSKVTLARAVATSTALPPLLTPITLENRGETCGRKTPAWQAAAEAAAAGSETPGRALLRARALRSYEDPKRPYVHVFDGGLSENLGLAEVVRAMEILKVSPDESELAAFRKARTVVVIAVNALQAVLAGRTGGAHEGLVAEDLVRVRLLTEILAFAGTVERFVLAMVNSLTPEGDSTKVLLLPGWRTSIARMVEMALSGKPVDPEEARAYLRAVEAWLLSSAAAFQEAPEVWFRELWQRISPEAIENFLSEGGRRKVYRIEAVELWEQFKRRAADVNPSLVAAQILEVV